MAEHGGAGGTTDGGRRSRLAEYADMARNQAPRHPAAEAPSAEYDTPPAEAPPEEREAAVRREWSALVGQFRRTAVLVPLEDGAPLTGDHGGVRWIYAFTDEPALARFAIARGEGAKEWTFRRVLGARLLDVAVPAAGVPCGVAVDVGSEDGVLLPPVPGVVPEAVAVTAPVDAEADADADADAGVTGEEKR